MSKPHRSSRRARPTPASVGDKPVPDAAASTAVTFRLQRLEPRLLWAISSLALWIAVVLQPSEPTPWLLALLAAVLGAWAQMAPARVPALMGGRAALLLAGGFLLQVNDAVGGAEGAVFMWPVLVTVAYTLLLPRGWAFALWGAAAIEFVAARTFDTVNGEWRLQLVQAAVLAVFSWIAFEYARSARDLDEQSDAAKRDRNSRLYNEMGFFAHGDALFDECKRRNRPFAMVLLNSADLREVSSLAGKKAANQLFAQLVQGIDAATPADGLAARTDAVEFGMALPGLTAAKASALVHQKLGNPPKVEVTVKGTRLTVMLDLLVAEAGSDVSTLEDMYDRLRVKLLSRAGQEPTTPSGLHSTLQGMLEPDSVIPRNARPTMPMEIAAPERRPRKRQGQR